MLLVPRPAMHELGVPGISGVLHLIEVVAGLNVHPGPQVARLLEELEAREGWLLVFSQIGEDETEIFVGRIAPDADLFTERIRLFGLFDAEPGGVVGPAVIEAAEVITFHPASGELRAAVRAAERHQMRNAGLAPVKGEVLAQHAD